MNRKAQTQILIIVIIAIAVLFFLGRFGLLSFFGSQDDSEMRNYVKAGVTSEVSFYDYKFSTTVYNGYNQQLGCLALSDNKDICSSTADGNDVYGCPKWRVMYSGQSKKCSNNGASCSIQRDCGYVLTGTSIIYKGNCVWTPYCGPSLNGFGGPKFVAIKGCSYVGTLTRSGQILQVVNGTFETGGKQIAQSVFSLNGNPARLVYAFGSESTNVDGSCDMMSGSLKFLPDDYIKLNVSFGKEKFYKDETATLSVILNNDYYKVNGDLCVVYTFTTSFGDINKEDCFDNSDYDLGTKTFTKTINTSQVGVLKVKAVLKDFNVDSSNFVGFKKNYITALPSKIIIGSIESNQQSITVTEKPTTIVETIKETTTVVAEKISWWQAIINWFRGIKLGI